MNTEGTHDKRTRGTGGIAILIVQSHADRAKRKVAQEEVVVVAFRRHHVHPSNPLCNALQDQLLVAKLLLPHTMGAESRIVLESSVNG